MSFKVLRLASFVLCLTFCLSAFLPSCLNRGPERPNVILIITDDQGYGDIAAHGNPWVKTPVMDKLHDQSVCLTNFHVDPCCAPTRSALMTGQYSSRTGVWHTIGGRSLLGADNVTMAEVFRSNGYKTAIFGKWHLGENYPFRPMDRGFEESIVHRGGGVGPNPDYYGNDYFDDTYVHNGNYEKYEGYCNTVWFTEAMKFIKENQDNPFFCYVSTNCPHAPLIVDSTYSEPYRSLVPDRLPDYYGMVAKIDEDLGVFLAELEELDIVDNTILIFMTDNGPCPWFGGIIIDDQGFPLEGYSAGMRGGKIWGYENAHRVPCYIRWPEGELGGGVDVSNLTAHMDLLPTLIEWCGFETPDNARFDGISLNSLISNPEEAWPERTLFVHNQRVDYPVKYKEYQVLTEDWRLLMRDSLELYDIKADPGQKINIAADHPELVKNLEMQYELWWDDISVDFDKYNAIILGNEKANPVMLYAHDAHRVKDVPRFWAVKIEEAGKYKVLPYLRAKESGRNIENTGVNKAVLNIDEKRYEWIIDKDIMKPYTVEIEPGEYKLSCWLEAEGKVRNLYSVEVEKLGNDDKSECHPERSEAEIQDRMALIR